MGADYFGGFYWSDPYSQDGYWSRLVNPPSPPQEPAYLSMYQDAYIDDYLDDYLAEEV